MNKIDTKKGFTLIELSVARKRGFTLIELLISSTIFALIMVIVVGIFAWAAGYNSRLRDTRRIADNGRMVLTELSTQIRLSNGSIKLSSGPYISGVTLLKCSDLSLFSCVFVGYDVPLRYKSDPNIVIEPSDFAANAILVLQKDQSKVLFYESVKTDDLNYSFIKKELIIGDWDAALDLVAEFGKADDKDLSESGLAFNSVNSTVLIKHAMAIHQSLNELSDPTISMGVYFGGYGPMKSSQFELNSDKNQQPFIEMYLIGKSFNYESLRPGERAKFEAKTTIESRDYN